MLVRILSLSTVVSATLLALIFRTTSPATVHPIIILAVFFLVYVLALGVLTFFVYGVGRVVSSLPQLRDRNELSVKRSYIYASVLAVAPVILMGMISIGRASVYEIFLVVMFEIIVCFYIAKRQKNHR